MVNDIFKKYNLKVIEQYGEDTYSIDKNGLITGTLSEDTLKKCGMEYGAQLIIGEFEFPDRVYAGILYPKGKYRALRIILGEGKGHNWWCVMFPAICIDAGEKGEIDIKGLEMKSWIIEKLKSIDGGKLWEKIMRRLG